MFNIALFEPWVADMGRSGFLGSRAFGLLLMSLSCALPAYAAPPTCTPEIVGPWTGKVLDEGLIKQLRTDFATRSGALTGTYHVQGADGGYDGTLTDFTPSGPCAGQFQWHDRHGTGVVRIEFHPERDRFDGWWGDDTPLMDHVFTGHRSRPVPIS